jgi:D-aminopeptidase
LNDIHADVVKKSDVARAYAARSSDFAIGNVGAGTGTRAFSWKGGIGTASRQVKVRNKTYTVGVLIQTNYGGTLSILGVPVGRILGRSDFKFADGAAKNAQAAKKPDGSCMIVLATDAPFSARELKRIAKRAFFGIIRTGSVASHGSGDYVVAFSTDRRAAPLPDDELNMFFLAAADATEEAAYDAMFAAETMKGRKGNVLKALPKAQVLALLKKRLS